MANRFRNSHICVAERIRTGSFVRAFRNPFAILLAFTLLFSCASASAAEDKETDQNGSKLTLPSYVMDGMVLQQNKITTLNGSTAKSMSGQTISVTLRGGKNQYNASSRISKNGKFSVQLPKIKGSLTQYIMKFMVADTMVKTVNDVYVGNFVHRFWAVEYGNKLQRLFQKRFAFQDKHLIALHTQRYSTQHQWQICPFPLTE